MPERRVAVSRGSSGRGLRRLAFLVGGRPASGRNSTSSRWIREPSTLSTLRLRPWDAQGVGRPGLPPECLTKTRPAIVEVLLLKGRGPNASLKSSIMFVPSMWTAVLVDPLNGAVLRKVELVLDLADDLLEDVLEGHDSLYRAVFVDHHHHVLLLAPEEVSERGQILGLRDNIPRGKRIDCVES